MSQVSIALDIHASLGECPRWDEQAQVLYWVDINNKQLHRFDPVTGQDEFLTFEQEIGCFALRKQGGFVLAMRHGFYLLDGWNTNLQFITDPEAHLEKNRFNDGRVDALGRLWAGSVYPPKDYNGARKSSDSEAMKKEDRSLSKVTVLDDVVFDGEAERDISAADDGLTRVAGLANEEVAEELQSTTYSAASQKRLVEKPSKQAKSRANNAVDLATKEKAIVAGVPAPAPAVVAADSSYAQGLISYKEGNYRDAAKDLRKATERTPNNLEAHIYAADAFLRISQPQAALFHIERILAVPGNSHIEDAEWYKALAYLQLKDASKAKRQLEVVVTRGGKYKAHAETALKNLK